MVLVEEIAIPPHNVAGVWVQTLQLLKDGNFPPCLLQKARITLTDFNCHCLIGFKIMAFGYKTKGALPKKGLHIVEQAQGAPLKNLEVVCLEGSREIQNEVSFV